MGQRKTLAGAATPTRITSTMTVASPGVGATFTIEDSDGWPSPTAAAPMVVTVDRGEVGEEKILVDDRSGLNLRVAQRGYDGTTAAAHTANVATCEHTIDAVLLDEANAHANDEDATAHAAAKISFAPAGGVAAATVQAAIEELDGDKAAAGHTHDFSGTFVDVAGDTMAGELVMADQLLTRPVLKDYAEEKATNATATGAVSVDCETANVHELTLTGNVTLTLSNPPATGDAGSLTLIIRQDGTGSRTITWPASVKWEGGTAPTLSTAASAVDIISLITVDGGTTWFGFLGGKAFS